MLVRKFLLLLLMALGLLAASAATVAAAVAATPAADQPTAEELIMAARQPDYVRTSLLIIGPGNEVYTAYGHSALRLQCPTRGLDYCFTFEMALTAHDLLRFFFGTPKAGFMVAPTSRFLDQYRRQGRSVTEYELNLSPLEEQALWRHLDEEVKQPPRWRFDVMENTCTSMTVYIVEKSLIGERIVYHQLAPVLTGSYRDVTARYSDRSPWAKVFWDLKCGFGGWCHGDPNTMMMPQLLADTWMKATIDGDSTGSRQLVVGRPRQLAPQVLVVEPSWLSPTLALVVVGVLVAFVVCGVVVHRRRRSATDQV